jgi:PadR family transcriptional regulator PadR
MVDEDGLPRGRRIFFEILVNCIDRYSVIHHSTLMNDRFFDNWSTQLRKGMLELCILNAIDGSRLYGYDIVRRLREIEALVVSEGTVYPILSRLRREGFLESTLEESGEGPARKYYTVSDKGRRILDRMNDCWTKMKSGTDKLKRKE